MDVNEEPADPDVQEAFDRSEERLHRILVEELDDYDPEEGDRIVEEALARTPPGEEPVRDSAEDERSAEADGGVYDPTDEFE